MADSNFPVILLVDLDQLVNGPLSNGMESALNTLLCTGCHKIIQFLIGITEKSSCMWSFPVRLPVGGCQLRRRTVNREAAANLFQSEPFYLFNVKSLKKPDKLNWELNPQVDQYFRVFDILHPHSVKRMNGCNSSAGILGSDSSENVFINII